MLEWHGRTLKSLNFTSPSDSVLPVLQAISVHCTALQELWLPVTPGNTGIVFLTPLLEGLKHLHLVSSVTPLDDASIWPMIPHLRNLEMMEIGHLRDIAIFAALLRQCPKLQRFVACQLIQLLTNKRLGYDLLFWKQCPTKAPTVLSDHLHPSIFPKPVHKLSFDRNSCTSDEAASLLALFGGTLRVVAFDNTHAKVVQELPACKPPLQAVIANCPHLTELHCVSPVGCNDIATIVTTYGRHLKGFTIHLGEDNEHKMKMCLVEIALCPNLEHLAVQCTATFPHNTLGRMLMHCPTLLSVTFYGRELTDGMIAELILWRGSRPLEVHCRNKQRVAALIRQHHRDAGTVNPWTCFHFIEA